MASGDSAPSKVSAAMLASSTSSASSALSAAAALSHAHSLPPPTLLDSRSTSAFCKARTGAFKQRIGDDDGLAVLAVDSVTAATAVVATIAVATALLGSVQRLPLFLSAKLGQMAASEPGVSLTEQIPSPGRTRCAQACPGDGTLSARAGSAINHSSKREPGRPPKSNEVENSASESPTGKTVTEASESRDSPTNLLWLRGKSTVFWQASFMQFVGCDPRHACCPAGQPSSTESIASNSLLTQLRYWGTSTFKSMQFCFSAASIRSSESTASSSLSMLLWHLRTPTRSWQTLPTSSLCCATVHTC
mmetsp:Transcript_27824/g.73903  ORF Transcript_27824/g.73903 Transcript_27824/m.73903 type:complete len:305 (+) Transcript_27824:674-1588(+)